MMSLKLYYFPECPFCQIVLDKITELKIEDKIDLKNTRTNFENREFLITSTGRATVPCLFIDESPMHESRDICSWLEENVQKI